jgi:hypothetical protein
MKCSINPESAASSKTKYLVFSLTSSLQQDSHPCVDYPSTLAGWLKLLLYGDVVFDVACRTDVVRRRYRCAMYIVGTTVCGSLQRR